MIIITNESDTNRIDKILDESVNCLFKLKNKFIIEVKNLRIEKPTKPYQIKVDRSSVLGNPFTVLEEWQRDEVCEKYEKYFYEQKARNEEFLNELRRIYKLGLNTES